MSVGEEQIECPLCMEPLEMDDINFFPCTCGYQICRFCWHRIRTDENGLCPACRKPYPEDPAEFKPLTEDELQRIKRERRQKDLQRKQKAAENRKHLANVRVVQKNLVFVVGLSQRLAEPEVLKKHEYFGKFGKIHKVVINQSTSYAGAQGPSASAYVTYNRPEDALRAIQAVNNIHVDGRTIKASLGTTKYCSHFLRGTQCPKPDCMYLHELGEEAASFTKEEMQQGKHQEYEQRLYEQYMNNQNLINHTTGNKAPPASTKQKTGSPIMGQQAQPPHHANKDAWPSLNSGKADSSRVTNGHKAPPQQQQQQQQAPAVTSKTESNPPHNRAPGNNRNRQIPSPQDSINGKAKAPGSPPQPSHCGPPLHTSGGYSTEQATPPPHTSASFTSSICKSPFLDSADSSLSLFSSSGFPTMKSLQPATQPQPQNTDENIPNTEISDTIPVSSSTDWQAAFGFGSSSVESHDDDLGFDPWRESTKALADLMEKEGNGTFSQNSDRNSDSLDSRARVPPPGFSCQMGAFNNPLRTDFAFRHRDNMANNHSQDWQDGLRALLPNINISFGGQQGQSAPLPQPPHSSTHHTLSSPPPRSSFNNSTPQQVPATANSHRQTAFTPSPPDLSWDPAIVSSGHIADKVIGSSEEPHWMASLQHLTEIDTPTPNHRFPCLQPFPFRAPTWAPQTQHPPPGFQAPLQPTSQMPGTQKVAGGLQ